YLTLSSRRKSPPRLPRGGPLHLAVAAPRPTIHVPRRSARMLSAIRHLSPLDRVLVEVQRALETTLGDPPASRPCPARADDPVLPKAERRHAAGLMRINHVGEVCAQGLYSGQAAVARDPATREHLL